jgi:hypothetical protein
MGTGSSRFESRHVGAITLGGSRVGAITLGGSQAAHWRKLGPPIGTLGRWRERDVRRHG